MIARHVRVTGRVQGVAFRAWAKEMAEDLDVRGWVRNNPDGSVEAHVEGDEGRVEDFIGQLRHGPALARVDDLDSKPAEAQNFAGFALRR